ncbi:hypothetical protein BGX26_011855 [Mortierella sp. AD094]|nr:hypothetical protein BGX26_011855 [Mortierella sp. AD094]
MELDVFFEFTESERNLQPLIFERLSALVQLRNLSVGLICFQSGKQPTGGLDIRLSCGLKSLASLKQLESLNVSGTVQSIGEEDVNWMVANWRSLHKFLGTKNTMDETANKVIEGILKLHGIRPKDSANDIVMCNVIVSPGIAVLLAAFAAHLLLLYRFNLDRFNLDF